MKIISKIYIHPLYILVAFICIISGLFKEYLMFTSIILFHELGHIFMAIYFKWNIEKIIILPFGGLTLFNEYINKSINEELLIAMLGPVFQILYLILFNFNDELFIKYNIIILVFNLIPIHPLDGSKIVKLILQKFLPFKLTEKLILVLSYMNIFLLTLIFINNFSLTYLIILLFILINVFKETKNYKSLFNKFLLERYMYEFNFKKEIIINGDRLNKMYKNKRHIFYIDKKYITEREIIRKRFDLHIKM